MALSKKFWVVIPAAGKGRRMESSIPKQFLNIDDRPVIAYTLNAFLSHPQIEGVVVVINEGDQKRIPDELHKQIQFCQGGDERWQSVLNGLNYLRGELHVDEQEWILVHDAARPCLSQEDLSKLIHFVVKNQCGAILASPVADTLKKVQKGAIQDTVDRNHLWRALTPQMFPLGLLRDAIHAAKLNGENITDEASAMEMSGYAPLVVQGNTDNIKITYPQDLELARFLIQKNRINNKS